MESTETDELRLALSMRGGVSLAVWIGGGCAEIDELSRARADGYDHATALGPPNFYCALLKMAGYSHATIDVMTGASAGGLNGVVLAASRAYGFEFDRMLQLWIELADIELLSRDPRERSADSPHPASLLRGDEYFLHHLRRELAQLVERGDEKRAISEPFELFLSATLEQARTEMTDADPFAPLPEVRRNASFSFRYLGRTGDDGGDFQARTLAIEARPDSTVSLLALAGRATSSFPVAFEPASVGAEASRVFSDPPGHGEPPQRVIDGGVLDNIPVAKAIEAIGNAPTAGGADRWLVFLHPSPAIPEHSPSRLPASPRAFRTLLTTASAAWSRESLLDDLNELERLNAEVRRQHLRRNALVHTIETIPQGRRFDNGADPGIELLHETRQRLEGHLAMVRAHLDAARIAKVLSGHIRVRRPLTDGPDRAEWSEWLNAARRQLEHDVVGAVHRAYAEAECPQVDDDTFGLGLEDRAEPTARDAAEAAIRSPGGLMLTSNLVSSWLRCLEPDEHSSHTIELAALIAAELRQLVQLAVNWSDQAWLVAAAQGPSVDLSWAGTTARIGYMATRRVPSARLGPIKECFRLALDALGDVEPGVAGVHLNDVAAHARLLDDDMRAEVMAGSIVDDDPDDLGRWIFDTFAAVVEHVAARQDRTRRAPDVSARPDDSAVEEWETDPSFQLLDKVGRAEHEGRPGHGAGEVLEALVAVLTPTQASSLEIEEPVRFIRISGSNETPLRRYFAPGSGPFGVEQKLCGNKLGNFAAFCSARWRANDWMWGRLDASKSLVDLTMRPERLRRSGMSNEEIWRTVVRIASAAGMELTRQDRDTLRLEIEVARRGDDDLSGLARVREVLTEARQRQLFATLQPIIGRLDERPYLPPRHDVDGRGGIDGGKMLATGAEVDDGSLNDRMHRHTVGSETIGDLDSRRRTQIGMRLALVGHRAFLPNGSTIGSRVLRWLMWLTKPLYLFAAFGLLNVARALFVVNLLALGLWFGPGRAPALTDLNGWDWLWIRTDGRDWFDVEPTWSRDPFSSRWSYVGFVIVLLLTLLSAALAVAAWRSRRRRLRRHQAPRPGLFWYVSSTGLGVVGLVLNWVYGVFLGPVFILLTGAVLALLACLWMRAWTWAVVSVGTAGIQVAIAVVTWQLVDSDEARWLDHTTWMVPLALLATMVLMTALSTYAPVLHDSEGLVKLAKTGRKSVAWPPRH